MTTVAPLAYSPYDYGIHEDPYPTYARLRAEAPVFYNEELDFFAYARHADVLAAFRDVDHYSNAYGVSLDPAAFGPDAHRAMSFLAMDPPRHTRMRSIVGKSFTPRRVAAMEDGIRALAVAHLAPALEAGSFDFIADFAGRLPMDVISELVGVPESDRAEIRRLADPARVPDWVEETLRYDTSTQMLVRVTSQPVRVQGVDIEAGRRILLLLGSANRDEDVFPDPETYDLDRRTQDLVSFGSGRHFCMGAALARMEARVALAEVRARVKDYEVDPAGIARVHSINVRGFAALPTTVTPR